MRVAVLTNFIAPFRLVLFRELQKQFGCMKVFVSTQMEPNRQWPVLWDGLDVEVQKTITVRRTWHHPKGFSETLYVHFPYNTIALLTGFRPDVIVSVEFGLRTLQAALFCIVFPRTKLIVWAQVSESTEQARGRIRHLLRRFLAKRMDAVFVNGQSGKRYLQANFAIADDEIFLSPITTNVENFAQVPVARDGSTAKRMLYVGQFIERKGIVPFMIVLQTWCSDNPDSELELWLAGSGPLKEQVQALSWPTNVTVVDKGIVEYENLPALYADVGLLVFPTLADEWGLVTVEAMAAGVPVIGSVYAQSVEELVRPGVNGWTFEADNPDQIYRAIDDAMNTDNENLNQMRVRARDTALALTPEKVAAMMALAFEFVK